MTIFDRRENGPENLIAEAGRGGEFRAALPIDIDNVTWRDLTPVDVIVGDSFRRIAVRVHHQKNIFRSAAGQCRHRCKEYANCCGELEDQRNRSTAMWREARG